MVTRGTHLLIECLGCDRTVLDDAEALSRALRAAADAMDATVVGAMFHRFAPQGVTGVLLLSESHISVHTWPERGYAALDLFTCGTGDPARALAVLERALGAARVAVLRVARGEDDALARLRVEG
jgi:S-adenosylmethionine decarboxylase proenzyme